MVLRTSYLDGQQGAGEQQSKSYYWYDERAAQPVTQLGAKSNGRVSGFARKQAGAIWSS